MKKKKYIIHDEDGKQFEVEETESVKKTTDEDIDETIKENEDVHDESALTEVEIEALRKLAGIADKLVALVSDQTTDEDVDKDDIEDEDIDKEEVEKEEQVIDTDEEEKKLAACDSKKSFNSIENRKKTSDSIDSDEDINTAWAKRYNRR